MFMKIFAFCTAATLAAQTMLAVAKAQDARGISAVPAMPTQDLPRNGGPGLRTGHITSTGETVPDPGVPQASSGASPLDQGIARDSDRIDSSICRGC